MPSLLSDSEYRRDRLVERIRKSRDCPNRVYSEVDAVVLKLLQDYLYYKNNDAEFDINGVKAQFYAISRHGAVTAGKCLASMLPFIWGLFPLPNKTKQILELISKEVDPVFIADAFLRSVGTAADIGNEDNFLFEKGIGVIFDDLTCYYDATRPSRMECVLNSDFALTDEQKVRVRNVMDRIISNKISKYNNQPEYKLNLGNPDAPKILIVDQSYADNSVAKGWADENAFQAMLDSAIEENPDADIVIKAHPDSFGRSSLRHRGYYSHIESKGNVYKLTIPANPLSLIAQSDKVYVCTSQFGFEAIMLGKEVHTFGMPFYGGWGLTVDNLQCARRIRHRSVEDIFHVAYIMLSVYINPENGDPWEIEDAIDFLIESKKTYFHMRNK